MSDDSTIYRPLDGVRWWCGRCGTVRETPAPIAPWCRHGDITLAASRMEPIPAGHPFARGPLPPALRLP